MTKFKSFWRNHKVKIIVAVGFAILFAIIFSKLNRNTFVTNDDTKFPELIAQFPSLLDYLSNRISVWSSRILPETFTYIFAPLSVNYWRLASVIVYLLSVWLGYKLYKVCSPKLNDKKDATILAVIMGGLLLMGLSVLDNYGAVYWFTGAMNYFWLTPFFLAALYAPLYIFVNQKLPSKIWLIVSLIATLLTAISHEQFAMALLVLLAGLGIYQLVKNRRNVKNLIWSGAFLLVALAGFSLYFLAAGNGVRLEQEVATWLPEMYNVPLAVRLESNVRWFFDALINQTGYLLPVIWLSLATLLLRQSKQLPNIITAVTLIAFSILALFADKFMVITVFLREFYPVWGFVGNSKDWLPILIYALVLITTLVAMYLAAAGDKIKAIAPITLSVIAAATIGAVCLSPTVYVSNFRTLYVASVLLVVVIIILLNRLLSNSKSLRSDRH